MSAIISHCGLPAGVKRPQFIGRVGPALEACSPKTSAIVYLSKAFDNWTRDQDYEPNRICGVRHQVNGLAEKLSCTVRTVHSIECDLEDAPASSRGTRKQTEGATVLQEFYGLNYALIELPGAGVMVIVGATVSVMAGVSTIKSFSMKP